MWEFFSSVWASHPLPPSDCWKSGKGKQNQVISSKTEQNHVITTETDQNQVITTKTMKYQAKPGNTNQKR